MYEQNTLYEKNKRHNPIVFKFLVEGATILALSCQTEI